MAGDGYWVQHKLRIKNINSLGIGFKLTIGFGVLVGIVLLVVGLGFFAGLSATRHINATERMREPILHAATEARASLLKMVGDMRGYLVSGNARDTTQYDESRIAFEEHLNILKSLFAKSNVDRNAQNIAEVESIYRVWSKLPPRLFSLHDNPLENRLALQLARVEVQPLRTQVLYQIDELLKTQVGNAEPRLSQHRDFLANLREFRTSFDAMVTNLVAYAASGERNFKLAHSSHSATNNVKWDLVFSQRTSLAAAQREKLDAIAQWHSEVVDFASRIFEIMGSDQVYQDLYLYRTQAAPQAERMMTLLEDITKHQQALFRADLRQARDSLSAARIQTVAGGLIAAIFGTLMAFLLRRHIVDKLRQLTGVAEQVAGGDLSGRAKVETNDEIGILARALNTMTQRLSETIVNLEAVFAEAQQAKEKAEEATTELKVANKELESFSYSVSHDLRAPLRHVQGYVELLREAAGDQLSEKLRRYLDTIAKASAGMGQLIDDLLAFSRIGRTGLRERPVCLDDLVRDTVRDLEMAVQDRNIVWKIGLLPSVIGDPSVLKLVLANLIGNAVKYTRPRDPAEIEIGCAGERDGRCVLFVRDNGVGFDMQYANKLFGVFQRLHRADEFEGTGIGLATARRIIARHGGHTWAEGAVDRGATLYFTLKPASGAQS